MNIKNKFLTFYVLLNNQKIAKHVLIDILFYFYIIFSIPVLAFLGHKYQLPQALVSIIWGFLMIVLLVFKFSKKD